MAKEKIILNQEVLDELLPGETIKIGSMSITIEPLPFIKYKLLGNQIIKLIQGLQEEGINTKNWNENQNLVKITQTIFEDFPNILSEATNIAQESLEQLPPDTLLDLTVHALEINTKSKESFLGNLDRLTETVNNLFEEKDKKVKPQKKVKS